MVGQQYRLQRQLCAFLVIWALIHLRQKPHLPTYSVYRHWELRLLVLLELCFDIVTGPKVSKVGINVSSNLSRISLLVLAYIVQLCHLFDPHQLQL